MISVSSAQARLDRLQLFVAAYRALDWGSDTEALDSFCKNWRNLAPVRTGSGAASRIDADQLEVALGYLKGPLAAARADGRFLNPWIVAGLRRGEVRNAAVLASLWRPETSGPSARAFLNCFFRHLERQHGAALPTAVQLEAGYMVRTEHCLAGDASERVDLTIEGKDFMVGVEIKIDAAEGVAQVDRYLEALSLRSRLKAKRAWLIFLAPYPHRGDVCFASDIPIIDASWRDLIAASQQCLPPSDDSYSFSDELIERFARHVSGF